MARKRINMRQIIEVLELALSRNLSANEIHRSTGISRGKIQAYVKAAKEAGLSWEAINSMDAALLERIFYPQESSEADIEPDFSTVHQQLKQKGVTRYQLWSEYKEEKPQGFCYAYFTKKYKRWKRRINLVMRQEHIAGEKLFVDFAGKTVRVIDRETGTVSMAQIFVAVLGASNYTYVKALPGQDLASWIDAHMDAFKFFGGVSQFVVPDNLKSAVTKADRYDPVLNRTYRRLAQHYGFTILPARPRKPRDKAKAEFGVKLVEMWILACLRNRDFFSLDELNAAIGELLEKLNAKPFQKFTGCRKSWFESLDAPALQKLPENQFEQEEWKTEILVPKCYHVDVDAHLYSVPCQYVDEQVDLRITDTTVEIFHGLERVASHARSFSQTKKSTTDSHMPKSHKQWAGRSAETFLEHANQIGPCTKAVIEVILNSQAYPQLSFDKCAGILYGMKKKYSPDEIERACQHALRLKTPTYRLVKELLAVGLDNLPSQVLLELSTNIQHENIRGAQYYK